MPRRGTYQLRASVAASARAVRARGGVSGGHQAGADVTALLVVGERVLATRFPSARVATYRRFRAAKCGQIAGSPPLDET